MDTDPHRPETRVPFRSGFVGIIGAPNVGKSTLLNQLLGEKIAIITPKPQTTRRQIRGILTGMDFQIVFVDTPGIHNPKKPLNKILVHWATQAARDVDAIVYVVDVTCRHTRQEFAISDLLREVKRPVILILNKIDRVAKETLLPLIDELKDRYPFEAIIPVSARYGRGIDRVLDEILKILPEGPQLYNARTITDQSKGELAAEFIREKVFLFAHQEVPYSTAVEVEKIEEDSGQQLIEIVAIIYVERPSQKGIIIGRGGHFIKKIGTLARQELEALWGQKIYLDIRVKVLKEWSKDRKALRRLGLLI